jgi:hypothetical protein
MGCMMRRDAHRKRRSEEGPSGFGAGEQVVMIIRCWVTCIHAMSPAASCWVVRGLHVRKERDSKALIAKITHSQETGAFNLAAAHVEITKFLVG